MPAFNALAGLSPICCAVRAQMEHCPWALVTVAHSPQQINMENTHFFIIVPNCKITDKIANCGFNNGLCDPRTRSMPGLNFFSLQHFLKSFSLVLIEDRLAQPDFFGGHFNAFILLDIFHALFQCHLDFRNDTD